MASKYSRKSVKRDRRSINDKLVDATRPASLRLHTVFDLLHSGARMYKIGSSRAVITSGRNPIKVPPELLNSLIRLGIIAVKSKKLDHITGKWVVDYRCVARKYVKHHAIEVSREDDRKRASSVSNHATNIDEELVDVFC